MKSRFVWLQMYAQYILLNCWGAFYIFLLGGICYWLPFICLGICEGSWADRETDRLKKMFFSCQVGQVPLFYLKEGIQQLISRRWCEKSKLPRRWLFPPRAQCWQVQRPLPGGAWGYGVQAPAQLGEMGRAEVYSSSSIAVSIKHRLLH